MKRNVTQEEDLLSGEEVEEKILIFWVAMMRTRIKPIQNQEGVIEVEEMEEEEVDYS